MQGDKFSEEEKKRMLQMLYQTGMVPCPNSEIHLIHTGKGLKIGIKGEKTETIANVGVLLAKAVSRLNVSPLEQEFVVKTVCDSVIEELRRANGNETD